MHEVKIEDHFLVAGLVRVLLVTEVDKHFLGNRIRKVNHIVPVALVCIKGAPVIAFLTLVDFVLNWVMGVHCLFYVIFFEVLRLLFRSEASAEV